MKKLGIIAAKGNLSNKLIKYAKGRFELFVIAINNETDPDLLKDIEHVWINLGEIGKAIDAFNRFQIKDIVFVGSLQKPDLLNIKVDAIGAKLLAKIVKDKFFGDNNLLSSITDFLEQRNFNIIGVHKILQDLVVKKANFTELHPNSQDQIDIELAMKVVSSLGELDIGQGAIVENGVVLGVEAVEGTDNLIKRCFELKRDSNNASGTLVKLSKPAQELRIDLPTIGIETIINMHKAGFKGIVIEANKAIFLDQEESIKYANLNKMFICALESYR